MKNDKGINPDSKPLKPKLFEIGTAKGSIMLLLNEIAAKMKMTNPIKK
jgi:hypothetical protein